jgi:hypothetical protein
MALALDGRQNERELVPLDACHEVLVSKDVAAALRDLTHQQAVPLIVAVASGPDHVLEVHRDHGQLETPSGGPALQVLDERYPVRETGHGVEQ